MNGKLRAFGRCSLCSSPGASLWWFRAVLSRRLRGSGVSRHVFRRVGPPQRAAGLPRAAGFEAGGARNVVQVVTWGVILGASLFPGAEAWGASAVTGTEFQGFYEFINEAATGYLGRGIAITGGLIALGIAAATGRYVVAVGGIVLAVFGALGPQIVDAIFGAVI